MPLRLRSAGGGSVLLKPPVALAADVSMEVPGYEGAKILTNKTPGAVLQVVQAVKTDTWSSSTTSFVDVTGLSVTITPTHANSKFYLATYLGKVSVSGSTWYNTAWRFTRNGSPIGVGDLAGVRFQSGLNITHYESNYDGNGSMFYLDSPGVLTPVTYTVQTAGHGSGTMLLNYSENDANLAVGYAARTASNLVVMEIAA